MNKRIQVIGVFATWVALIAAVVIGLATLQSSRESSKRLREIRQRIEHLESWVTTPILDDLKAGTFCGREVKYREFNIVRRPDLDELTRLAWGNRIPYPSFFVDHRDVGDVAFHPYQWSCNLLALSERLRRESHSDLSGTLAAEIARAEQFVRRCGDGDFYEYPFRYQIGGVTLPAPWFSAFGQAYVVAAFVALHHATGDATWLQRARRALRPLFGIRGADRAIPWVTFVDDTGFLWFEEYAGETDTEPRVLNGHIQALMGMYSYWLIEPDDDLLMALRAGITTVQRYTRALRQPGGAIRYGLGTGAVPDYGPLRAVNQQQWLYDLTQDECFAQLRDMLATDRPVR